MSCQKRGLLFNDFIIITISRERGFHVSVPMSLGAPAYAGVTAFAGMTLRWAGCGGHGQDGGAAPAKGQTNGLTFTKLRL